MNTSNEKELPEIDSGLSIIHDYNTYDIVAAVQFMMCKLTNDSFYSRVNANRLYLSGDAKVEPQWRWPELDECPEFFEVTVKHKGKTKSMIVRNYYYE